MKNKAIAIGAALLLTAALAFSYTRYSGSECCDPSKAANCQKMENCDPQSCPQGQECCPMECCK